jgi:hypothetical protein
VGVGDRGRGSGLETLHFHPPLNLLRPGSGQASPQGRGMRCEGVGEGMGVGRAGLKSRATKGKASLSRWGAVGDAYLRGRLPPPRGGRIEVGVGVRARGRKPGLEKLHFHPPLAPPLKGGE